ncbi:pentapeptide repeat-containing protein [Escherichia coli]|nr:pentapeptide repeat-containing protein [Escherichia coli]
MDIANVSMFSSINNNYQQIARGHFNKPWVYMTTAEKFFHIITVGLWSFSIPDEAKEEFDGFVNRIIEGIKTANNNINEQTVDNMDEEMNVVTARFFDLDVEYSVISNKFFLKHANGQRSELICSPAVRVYMDKDISPERIKYALNKFINLRNQRDRVSHDLRFVCLAVKREVDNSQTVTVDFIDGEEYWVDKKITCSIPGYEIINLSNTNLEKVGLNKADLTNANLRNANLKNAFFMNTHLEGADLEGANMEGAELLSSYFDDRSSLIRADLTRALMCGAFLTGVNLTKARLTGADLTGAKLIGAKLIGAKLINADLTRADLTRADLTDATLSEAHGQSKVELVYHNKVDWLFRVKLIGANLTEAILANVDLTGVDLTDVNLTGANLTGADLNGVDLTGANLTGADLNGACLVGVKNWDKANWEGVRNWGTARLPVGLRKHLEELAATSEHRF